MSNDAVIQVRMDTKTKTKAVRFFKQFGLSTSDGVRLLIHQAMVEKNLRTPTKLTAETLAKSERGEDVHQAKDAKDLFNQLGI